MATYNQATRPNVYGTPGGPSNLPVTATIAPTTAATKPVSRFTPADPLFQTAPLPANTKPLTPDGQIQQNIQTNLPFTPNNGNPNGANNMPTYDATAMPVPSRYPVPQRPQQGTQMPSQARRAYLNNVSGQQSDLGRYRPPTLAGNGNDPMNWNDYGGYDYNLPSAYGPTPNTPYSQGPYGGYASQRYPSYLQPNWMNNVGSAPRPMYPGDPLLFPGGG